MHKTIIPQMDRIRIAALVMVLLFVCSNIITGCAEKEKLSERCGSKYQVKSLNGENQESGYDYFYKDYHTIYHCNLLSKQWDICVSEEEKGILAYTVWGNWVYYVTESEESYFCELWKKNLETGEVVQLITREEFEKINKGIIMGGTVWSYVSMNIYDEYLYITFREAREAVLMVGSDEAHNNVFRFPLDGNPETDFVNINALFEMEGESDSEKLVLDGIAYERYYSEVIEDYRVSDVRVENDDEALIDISDVLIMIDKERIDYMGQKVIFSCDEKANKPYLCYQNEQGQDFILSCLPDEEYTHFHMNEFVQMNGGIVGLINVCKNTNLELAPSVAWKEKDDILFWMNPVTGENRILYITDKCTEMIIGYHGNRVYLFEYNTVYDYNLLTEEKRELFQVGEIEFKNEYEFDWQSGFLIITNEDKLMDKTYVYRME